MESKKNAEQLMLKTFPSCPICTSNKGYKATGFSIDSSNNYVQCKHCGTKWGSGEFSHGKRLTNLILWKTPRSGKGKAVLGKIRSVNFWMDFDAKIREEKVENSKKNNTTKNELKISGVSLNSDQNTLRNEIIQSLRDLQFHEAGSKWNSLGVFFTGNSAERLMADMLKGLVDQNKIIIRQNELILRAINNLNDNNQNTKTSIKEQNS